MDITVYSNLFISALTLGALYAFMAFGLAIVWTVLGIFNFAQGVFVALGAYIAWTFTVPGHIPLVISGLLTGCAMAIFGIVFELLVIRPFERKPNIVLLTVLSTLAASVILVAIIDLVWGPRSKQIPLHLNTSLLNGGITLNARALLVVAAAAVLYGVLNWFFTRTQLGLSMRAVAQNRQAAQLFGVRAKLLYAVAFAIAGATAGIAGIFIGSTQYMNPAMGDDALSKALVVVILGGITHFRYPIYSAFIIALIETFSSYWFGLYWTPAILFGIIIITLILKPEGIFVEHIRTV